MTDREPYESTSGTDPAADASVALEALMQGYGLNHEPIGWLEAAKLLSDGDKRQVALSNVQLDDTAGDEPATSEWCISTVFMPWDMGHGRTRVPVLYESMVLDNDGEIRRVSRYATRQAALAGHDQLVVWARAGGQPEPLPWSDALLYPQGDETAAD